MGRRSEWEGGKGGVTVTQGVEDSLSSIEHLGFGAWAVLIDRCTWEDENEEGADSSNEADNLGDVRDKEGRSQAQQHPASGQQHPRPPPIASGPRHMSGPARYTQLLDDRPV